MMAKEVKKTTRKAAGTAAKGVTGYRTKAMPTEEQIRARAYQIYLARNNGPGDALSDWILAERELIEEMSR